MYNNPFSQGRRAQRWAAAFGTQKETTRVINLVDEYGNNEFVRRHGQINITKHINVLSALKKWELQYRKKVQVELETYEVLFNDAIDDTGTVSEASLINPDDKCKEQYLYEKRRSEKCEMEEIKGVTNEVLKVHVIAPRKKGEGVTIVIYENPNGFK